ncbi:hypothetical protein MUY27_20415 [Mucilaginibacter sp. RS28]|uniref:Uncharacterized protein n=1 Tax=Mucilaginibacter straminoryzae TaxID=2932774 RepID=A0A9X1X741_9SPHI|nr:hypothetical protein [Mucilaginibacter straminoryzae]MCJ8212093.1 hypothetical protein [Mucilaginibacter straminoryzae]
MKALLVAPFAASLLMATYAHGQNKQDHLQPPPAGISIDGSLKDWGDSLRYYNEDKKLYYSLANDQENLYMAMRVNDLTEQRRILAAGLTLGVNPKGKKKETYSITFPVGETGNAPFGDIHRRNDGGDGKDGADNRPSPDADAREEMMRARLTKLRNIKVTGFPDIESEVITTANTYGIKTAIDIDKDGYLVYEAAIPLKFFHAEINDKNEWAFNFKINGISAPSHPQQGEGMERGGGMRGGGGGMGGGMRGGGMGRGGMRGGGMNRGGGNGERNFDMGELGKSVDFWQKFKLSAQ